MSDNPKVFISYAHKDVIYEDKVLELANRLRVEGIDAMIDQYEEAPSEGWPRWTEKQIIQSDYVLILCEETYNRKLYESTGKGVVWEANLVYQLLYDSSTDTKKFIAAFFEENDQQFIPLPLKPYTFYNLSDESQYQKLYWRFRGITNSKKPPLGKLKPLSEKERKTLFFTSPIATEKWNDAKWKGIAYLWGGDAPAIGIFFGNYPAGKAIFYEWKTAYKDLESADPFLKIDYVVPPFPKNCWVNSTSERNYGKGYFVHIGSNIDASISRAASDGLTGSELIFATVSRFQWMDEINGSKNREQFLEMYRQAGKYYLVPVGIKKGASLAIIENMEFDFDCAIPMRDLTITSGIHVTDDNPCKAVLKKPENFD